jgi:ABC-type branched-subunit amino acid transport system substrate-binding protein
MHMGEETQAMPFTNIAESRIAAVREFVEAYQVRYHAEPSMFAAQAYEAAQVVLMGIRGGATSGKKLRANLGGGALTSHAAGAHIFQSSWRPQSQVACASGE